MSSTRDQQSIFRTVGTRQSRDGQPLKAEDRPRMGEMARYRTRAPKGVFFYSSHEEMEADRLRWTVDAVVARHLAVAAGAVLNTSGGVDMPSEEFLDLDETG